MYVKSTQLGNGAGRIVYQPDHPLADANGNVKYPDIDMAEQMGALIIAQRGYQANAQVVDRARETYSPPLRLEDPDACFPYRPGPGRPAHGLPLRRAPRSPGTDGSGFASSLTGAVDNLQQLQSTSKQLAVSAVTGNLDDIHNATIAASRAQITLELVATVRNKGVDAFNEIMRMQA